MMLLAMSIPAVPAVAQDKPAAPTAPVMSEKHGKIVRDEPDALRVQDMTDAELQQRLAEYEAGKRDYRDGYIILNQLAFNHQLHKTVLTEEGQRVSKLRQELLKKYPRLSELKDFRLSDRIRREQKQQAAEAKRKQEAKQFVPKDATPGDVRGEGDRAVVKYQYRLEFLKLAQDVKVQGDPHGGRMQLVRAGNSISPTQLQASKTLQFKHPVNLRYGRDASGGIIFGNMLVCTDMLRGYSAKTPEERELIRLAGHERSMPWTNPSGQYDDFCG
ncbi:MAG: hypothetical protein ABL955_07275, partial [Elusimicrobiota bacterium]